MIEYYVSGSYTNNLVNKDSCCTRNIVTSIRKLIKCTDIVTNNSLQSCLFRNGFHQGITQFFSRIQTISHEGESSSPFMSFNEQNVSLLFAPRELTLVNDDGSYCNSCMSRNFFP